MQGPPEPPRWLARCVLAALLLVSTASAVWHASVKPLWFDEILTAEVGSLPTGAERWQALYDGCDGMPPGSYWLTALAGRVPLDPHIRWRLPGLVGWPLALLGVYLFAAAAAGRQAGLAAVLLLSLTPAASYAYEARPYALLVGTLALAAVCWQRVSGGWRWSFGLAALLTVATNLHYLAPLSVFCFALAEVVLSLAQRHWRLRVWVAFTIAAIPPIVALPLLLKMKADFAARFWSLPEPGGVPYYYGNLVGLPLNLALVLLPFGFASLLQALLQRGVGTRRGQAVLWTSAILLLPLVSVAFTMATHGGFNERYAMPVILGYALALPLLVDWSPGRPAGTLVAALLLAFLVIAGRDAAQMATYRMAWQTGPENHIRAALGRTAGEPLVVANALEFLPAWYYGRQDERRRIVFVGDLDSSARLGHTDGAVRLLLALRRFFPVPVQTFDEFLPGRRDFLLVTNGAALLNWQTLRLEELGWRLQPLGPAADGQLYRVFAPAQAPDHPGDGRQ